MAADARPAYGPRRARNAGGTRDRKREWWHYLLAGIGLAVLLGIIWGIYAIWFSLTHVRTSYARVSGFVVSLSAKDDTRVQQIPVHTGDVVKKGQTVALLDKADLEAQVEQAEASLEAAKSALARAETDLEMTIRQTAASADEAEAQLSAAHARLAQAEAELQMQARQQPDEVRKAQAELSAARSDLARLKAGPRPQEVEQGRADVKAAESHLAQATSSLQRLEKLHQEGAVSAQVLDTARMDKDVAEATLASARQKLNMLEAGTRQEDIQAGEQAVAAAEAALAVANAKTYEGQMKGQQVATRQAEQRQAQAVLSSTLSKKSEVALKEQDVLAQRAAVGEAQAQLDSAKARLSDAVLRSTTDGVVVRGPGRSIHEGESVAQGEPIVTIVSTEGDLWISASVSELTVARVEEGQPVLIRIDAFPRRKFRGKVAQVGKATEISTTASSPWQLQQVPIKITFDTNHARVIPGMTCQAWIDVR
jgi:multidrug resistance efflux pump